MKDNAAPARWCACSDVRPPSDPVDQTARRENGRIESGVQIAVVQGGMTRMSVDLSSSALVGLGLQWGGEESNGDGRKESNDNSMMRSCGGDRDNEN